MISQTEKIVLLLLFSLFAILLLFSASVKKFFKNEPELAPPIKVTIPEGFNTRDMSDILVLKLANSNKEKFFLFG